MNTLWKNNFFNSTLMLLKGKLCFLLTVLEVILFKFLLFIPMNIWSHYFTLTLRYTKYDLISSLSTYLITFVTLITIIKSPLSILISNDRSFSLENLNS